MKNPVRKLKGSELRFTFPDIVISTRLRKLSLPSMRKRDCCTLTWMATSVILFS